MFFKFSTKSLAILGLLSNFLIVNGKTDCDVLTSLYKGFKIENKVTWDENTNSCCSQSGIECSNNRITKIELKDNKLSGSISNEITSLTELTYLDLRYNNITGTIPENIDSLSKLTYLNLGQNNGISGTIPKQICSLKNLSELYLYNNVLTGNIPECIGELPKIIELCLDNNKLEGHIPSSIGELSNLKHLDLENNKLTGIIPESFSKLKNIEKINLQGNNGLIGNLPEIQGISDCLYTNTDLCVSEGSKTCSNNLRKCTEDDIKKVKEYKEKNNDNKNSENNDSSNSDNSSSSNSDNKSGGISVGVIIIIIVLILLAIVGGIFLCRKKNVEDDGNIIKSLSRKNILPVSTSEPPQSPKQEKSFVVLPSVKDDVSLPPKLTLDESIFNYVDVNSKANISLHEDSKISRTSTGIDQEQYQNQMQYQDLLNNQSYYLNN